MENGLIKSPGMPANITETMQIGKLFFESGLFTDLKSAAQAVVKIQAGAELGITPFASLSGIHIIQGKPTVGAGIIASRIKGSGKYDYRVLEQSEKLSSIDFYQGKEKIGNSTFTIDDAKKAQTKNIDKFPRNMLFARAISNGVKWFCPDVFMGPVYTPEDFEETPPQQTVEGTAEVMQPTEKPVTQPQPLKVVQPETKPTQTQEKEPVTLEIMQKLVNRITKTQDATILEKAKATYKMNEGEIKILQDEINKIPKQQKVA